MTTIEKLNNLKNCVIAQDTAKSKDFSGFIFCLRAHGLIDRGGMKLGHAFDILEAYNAGNDSDVVMILAHYN